MIISASRRTDIPNYYPEWFIQRLKSGYVCTKNPMNPHQVSRIALTPETVDCIVFWTKNPEKMIPYLEQIRDYPYYFQFTLTGYGRDIEPGVPHKKEKMISVFRRLSDIIGSRRVIWRYDPILFTEHYSAQYHLNAFSQIAEALKGCTEKCVVSFLDLYAKNKKALEELGATGAPENFTEGDLMRFCSNLYQIASENGLRLAACAEAADLSGCGIERNCCIDKKLIEEIAGRKLTVQRDKNQREGCGCVSSVDIGTYNTCLNGCKYCYANYSEQKVVENFSRYDVNGELLCGTIGERDIVREK